MHQTPQQIIADLASKEIHDTLVHGTTWVKNRGRKYAKVVEVSKQTDAGYLCVRALPDRDGGVSWQDASYPPGEGESIVDALEHLKKIWEAGKDDPEFRDYFYHRMVES